MLVLGSGFEPTFDTKTQPSNHPTTATGTFRNQRRDQPRCRVRPRQQTHALFRQQQVPRLHPRACIYRRIHTSDAQRSTRPFQPLPSSRVVGQIPPPRRACHTEAYTCRALQATHGALPLAIFLQLLIQGKNETAPARWGRRCAAECAGACGARVCARNNINLISHTCSWHTWHQERRSRLAKHR